MRERIKNVMAELWGLPVQQIPDNASPDVLAQWDSIAHLQLLLALEMEFEVQFPSEEMGKLLSLDTLENHLAARVATA
jgi:acyl carrier protein